MISSYRFVIGVFLVNALKNKMRDCFLKGVSPMTEKDIVNQKYDPAAVEEGR